MSLNLTYNTLDEIPEAFRELYSERGGKYELTGIVGLKTQADVDAMARARDNEKAQKEALKTKLSQVHFKGKSIVEMNADEIAATVKDLDRWDELEAGFGKPDEEKVNSLVEARIKTKLAPVERERDQLRNQLGEKNKAIETYTAKERQRAIHDAVRRATVEFKGGKFQPTALDDALMLAERVFDVGEDGAITVRDQVGFTPGLKPEEWLSEIADKRPHWFEASEGGGAKGGKFGNGNFSKNPWSRQQWNLTEQGAVIRTQGVETAKKMAAAAGSEVGATAPPEK